ncbi:hypothetical protein PS2_046319 [Malus domestica]
MPKLSSLRSTVACPPSSSYGGAAVMSSLGTSSSLSSCIVMWKTSWTFSSEPSSWACWHEDCPVWMMVGLSTFNCPLCQLPRLLGVSYLKELSFERHLFLLDH